MSLNLNRADIGEFFGKAYNLTGTLVIPAQYADKTDGELLDFMIRCWKRIDYKYPQVEYKKRELRRAYINATYGCFESDLKMI